MLSRDLYHQFAARNERHPQGMLAQCVPGEYLDLFESET
jgi:hypothetical protein